MHQAEPFRTPQPAPLTISPRERLLAGTATATVVGMFGYMLIVGLSGEARHRIEQSLVMLNLSAPTPPIEAPQPHSETHRAKASAAASPRALKNRPVEVAAPRPVILLPAPPPMISAPKAGPGTANAAGAADLPGPGTGAGGVGTGTGNGDQGDGDGDGGSPPRQIRGKLKIADLPTGLREPGTTHMVGVRYQVGTDGRVSNCTAAEPSGNSAIDRLTCALIEQRFVFRPSRDTQGRPVTSTIEERHSWIIETPRP